MENETKSTKEHMNIIIKELNDKMNGYKKQIDLSQKEIDNLTKLKDDLKRQYDAYFLTLDKIKSKS